MDTNTTVFIHSTDIERYQYPDSSPFKTIRAGLTRKKLHTMGLLSGSGIREVPPIRATPGELEWFHTRRYLSALEAAAQGNLDPEGFAMGIGTADCPVFKDMLEYASWAAGASLTGARMIRDGEAFIAFNPSGGYHHAHADHAGGFCYINDIVLSAMLLARTFKRILFLDLDVHHCDGVQTAFYDRRDVLTISMHENGRTLFPGTGFEEEIGLGDGLGYSVNIPLPPSTYDDAYYRAFEQVVIPLLHAYDPEVLILELGMDTLSGDPLAHISLTNNIYVPIIRQLMARNKPILATGGGGYHVENTVRGWSLVWSVLSGNEIDEDVAAGMGGVMLANTDWLGGLRDRVLTPTDEQKKDVDPVLNATIAKVRQTVFPYHGLHP